MNLKLENLDSILTEIIKEFEPIADSKKIYLKLEKPDKLPTIFADRLKLKSALFNIIDKSIRCTFKGGVIVKTYQKEEKIIIEIKDTGVGVLPEHARSLFEESREEDKNKLFKGIAFYLSGMIIRAHQGQVSAESDGENKGVTFFIELPCQ